MAATADDHYLVDVWTTETEPALPENAIIALTQTRDGYLWLGTLNGLVRFDGIRFAAFDESNTPGLESGPITYLFEDSHTNLWLGTHAGGILLIRNGQVTRLQVGTHTHEGRLISACEDAKGGVWLYTSDGQLFRYWEGKVEVCRIESLAGTGNCRSIIAERSGLVWVGTETRMFGFNPKAGPATNSPLEVMATLTNKLDLLLASRQGGYWRLAGGDVQKWTGDHLERSVGSYLGLQVNTACEDRDGNLILGTGGEGVWVFDAAGKAPPAQMAGISHNTILSLCLDREGTLWVGTDGGGLNRVKRQVFGVVPETLGKTVQSVCADDQGGILFGEFGGGLWRWKDQTAQQLGVAQGAALLGLRSIFMDHNRQIWAAADEWGLMQVSDTNLLLVLRAPRISSIYEDRSNQLWLGTQVGLVLWRGATPKVYNTNLSSQVVTALADDAAGNLWIGTGGGGLNCLRNGQITVIHKGSDGLPSEHITALFVDQQDVLWIGTPSGLARFHDGKWARYTTREGLGGNTIDYITQDDKEECLWIGSNAGLLRVSKQSLNDLANGLIQSVTCRSFGKADGLPTRECTQGSQSAACRSADGILWFATIRGLVFVNPASLKLNTNPPPVVIESVFVENQKKTANDFPGQLPREVVVSPGADNLEIQYASLNLSAPDKTRFRYRMADSPSTKWTEAGANRTVRYPKLPAGAYQFEVTACNEDGVWNPAGATIAITVLPPFWRKPWFIGMVAACLLVLIVGIVHYFSTQRLQRQLEGLRQQQALEKERSRIARDIHDQLGASLTQVSLLSEMVESDKNAPEGVEAHARQIAQTARETSHALDEIVWTVNPSNDTVDGLINYICKYAQDYFAVAGLRYRLDVPEQLPGNSISPEVRHNVFLAAKEAVTNVVRHARATEVWLRLHLGAESFTIELQDNGRGLAGMEEKLSRNGLRNMHKRMEDIGGSFAITPAPGGGALVRLTVPLGRL
jgi:signal transduction histidine kinase/streptogramin lyase